MDKGSILTFGIRALVALGSGMDVNQTPLKGEVLGAYKCERCFPLGVSCWKFLHFEYQALPLLDGSVELPFSSKKFHFLDYWTIKTYQSWHLSYW